MPRSITVSSLANGYGPGDGIGKIEFGITFSESLVKQPLASVSFAWYQVVMAGEYLWRGGIGADDADRGCPGKRSCSNAIQLKRVESAIHRIPGKTESGGLPNTVTGQV